MKKFLLFAAACVALVACKNDENIITNEPAEPGQTITLHATASMGNKGGAHKIAPNDITASSVAFHWEAGDQVILYTLTYSEEGYATGVSEMQVFTVKPGTINGAEADFTGTALSNMLGYGVYYVGKDVWTKEQLEAFAVNKTLEPFNYYPGSTNWFFMGSGSPGGLTILSPAAFRMQLKGDVKLGKVELQEGDGSSVATINFIHHEYTGLQLSSTAVDLTIPTAGKGGGFSSGLKLLFYDTSNNLIMEKSSSINLYTNFTNDELINLGEITVAEPAVALVAVDLGLSVKWANMNVGATKPEKIGTYFAWGETAAKSDYTTANYIDPGVAAGGTLPAAKDAAAVNLGSPWRMPTYAEARELQMNTNKEALMVNGVACVKLTSTIEGYTDKYIIVPGTGRYNDGALHNLNEEDTSSSLWWTSTRTDNDPYTSYVFQVYFAANPSSPDDAYWAYATNLNGWGDYRYYGMPVRAVQP